jgi:hypothetical protein
MKKLLFLLAIASVTFTLRPYAQQKVFDVHLHGSGEADSQLTVLKQAGVYKAAISTSWDLQNSYRDKKGKDRNGLRRIGWRHRSKRVE